MEEKKLLRFLNYIIYAVAAGLLTAAVCRADGGSARAPGGGTWAAELGAGASRSVLESLEEKFEEGEKADWNEARDAKEGPGRKFAGGLYLFVSSSMPLPLLKAYAAEARKYGAVLVFKGLPEGSFKKLFALVKEISGGEGEAAMQIDDEAFDRFGIVSVPAIVLSKEEDPSPLGTDVLPKFDKITGNAGIKYSLRKFAESGDLREEAKGRLNAE